MARLDGRSTGAASVGVSSMGPERPYAVHDGRQTTKDLLQVLFKKGCGCDPKMTLDDLPERME
jgi:hypothetical protein